MCCELTSMYELIIGYVVSSRYMTKSVKIVDLLSTLATLLCVKIKRQSLHQCIKVAKRCFLEKKELIGL